MYRRHRRALGAAAATLLLALSGDARAWDPFEIEVFHPQVNKPEQLGLELHSNYVPSGLRTSIPPELPTDQVLHEMLDASYGLGNRFELGVHLLTAIRGHEARVDFAGVKARLQWWAPLDEHCPIQAAVNVELSAMPDIYDPGIVSLEVRPIIDWTEGDFHLDLNPTIEVPFSGPYAGIAAIDPSLAIRYRFFETVQLSVEYYATSGPVTHVPHLRNQLHYLFEAVDIIRWPDWVLRAGIGEGLTPSSDAVVLTLLLGHRF